LNSFTEKGGGGGGGGGKLGSFDVKGEHIVSSLKAFGTYGKLRKAALMVTFIHYLHVYSLHHSP